MYLVAFYNLNVKHTSLKIVEWVPNQATFFYPKSDQLANLVTLFKDFIPNYLHSSTCKTYCLSSKIVEWVPNQAILCYYLGCCHLL